jgi:hypothetical protein
VEQSVRLPRFALQKTVPFSFSLDDQAVGTNLFRAVTDPNSEYDEVTEANNDASRELVVFDTGLLLVTPTDSDVVNTRSPTLRMNLLTSSTEASTIEVQVDTLSSFDSPALQEATLQSESFVVDWTPQQLENRQTYFWRARLASEGGAEWRQGRFAVRTSSPSPTWLQTDRFFAFNGQTRLTRSNNAWSFSTFNSLVEAFSERGFGASNFGFIVNATNRYLQLTFGFGVLVVDGLSGRVKAVGSFPTYDLRSEFEGEVGDQQQAIDSLRAFLDTNVDTGDYVYTRTRHLARTSGPVIPEEVKSLFRNLGSSSAPDPYSAAIDTLTYGHLWAMKTRKGMPSSTEERVSPPEESEVNDFFLRSSASFSHASGRTLTKRVGPAQSWSNVQWTVDARGDDAVQVDILAPQDSSVLATYPAQTSDSRSLTSINADDHPYLLFRATLSDSTDRTAPQLKEWSARFTPVPEIAVDPLSLAALPDTVQQGELVSPKLSIRHLDGPEASGVRLTTTLTSASNETTRLRVDTLGTLAPEASSTVAFDVTTNDRTGSNTLSFSVEGNETPERFPSNNTALHTVFVQSDRTPPSLAVFVEGRELPRAPDQISDLQDPRLPFVPLQPTFEIEVSDDNPFVQIADTSAVEMYLKEGLPEDSPDIISSFRRVPFSDPSLSFRPPQSADSSKATVLFEPALDPEDGDGTYTLKIEAQDPQGNELDPYQVTFRVQQEQVIEDLYPYPNPMSSHTQFAFRIRGGNTRPTDFTLRIYTLSGRLVREFGGTEVNDGQGLRTSGWNFLRWNGRDEDGDRVATGVYLYRVRMDGEDGTWEGDVEKIAVIR